jgi:hypothetical protein
MHVLAVRSHSRNSEKDDNYESDRVYVRLFSHCSAALAMVGARSAESFATALPHSLVFLLARDQPGRRRFLQGATPLAAAGPGPPADHTLRPVCRHLDQTAARAHMPASALRALRTAVFPTPQKLLLYFFGVHGNYKHRFGSSRCGAPHPPASDLMAARPPRALYADPRTAPLGAVGVPLPRPRGRAGFPRWESVRYGQLPCFALSSRDHRGSALVPGDAVGSVASRRLTEVRRTVDCSAASKVSCGPPWRGCDEGSSYC